MGHGLDEKKTEMAYANYAKPWHGLGTPVDGLMTSKDVMEKAGLDWEVVKEPIYIASGDPESKRRVKIPDRFATVRSDKSGEARYLGVVGAYYEPFQNATALDTIDTIVGAKEAVYDTAGALHGGKRVWLLAKLPKRVIVAGDVVDQFLLLWHAHDGTGSIEVMFTPTRVVCWNTLWAAMKGVQHKIKVRHTKSASDKIDEAKRVIGIASNYFDKVGEAYNDMQAFDLKKAILAKYFSKVFPDPTQGNATRAENVREQLTEIFEDSPAIAKTSGEGNLWGAYNAVTEYVQYYKSVPNFVNDNDAEHRFDKVVIGNSGAAEMRQRAFTEALELLKN